MLQLNGALPKHLISHVSQRVTAAEGTALCSTPASLSLRCHCSQSESRCMREPQGNQQEEQALCFHSPVQCCLTWMQQGSTVKKLKAPSSSSPETLHQTPRLLLRDELLAGRLTPFFAEVPCLEYQPHSLFATARTVIHPNTPSSSLS